MKRVVKILMITMGFLASMRLQAQTKIDDQRMERDIEVAENVLSTLVRQQFNKRNFFPFEVEGTYAQGFGVTFRMPMEFPGPMMFGGDMGPQIIKVGPSMTYSYSYNNSDDNDSHSDGDCVDCVKAKGERVKAKDKNDVSYRKVSRDSLSHAAADRLVAASKDFIVDYGDLIGQLTPDERIKITNRHEGQRFWYGGTKSRREFLSLECTKGDITQYKQGKITRDQLLGKINVVESETSEELSPDLELLSTMFNRLYSSDLSKTFYLQDNAYFERLKNYGVVYYMQVYSSNQTNNDTYDMVTANLEGVSKETRDKKVKELYPLFEKDIKESMLDYGRTLKSLKDEEILMLNIKLTQCVSCGIPSTLELSVKNSVLKDFSSGKLTKDAALAMISVKKGPNQ